MDVVYIFGTVLFFLACAGLVKLIQKLGGAQ